MINCAYSSFLKADEEPKAAFARLTGYQANASALDHSELDEAESIRAEPVSDWVDRMIELNRRYCIPILGGCCGTTREHLEYLIRKGL